MAALTITLQLLFLGALISPVYLLDVCQVINNSTDPGNFNLSVNPTVYKTNTTYNVTVSGATNSSSSIILQALNAANSSVGEWLKSTPVNCSNIQPVQSNVSSDTTTVQWKSPGTETAPVEISVFVTFNSSTQIQKFRLNAEPATAKTTPSATAKTNPSATAKTTPSATIKTSISKTTNSVSTAQASSFFVAVIQLLSVFVTSKLFSC